jgi:outer membrane protein OmpA-like peptidoglycan-associated protein
MDGWRLPTEAELTSAFLTPSGAIRQSGLLGLTDRVSSFGALPKYSLIWSINEDPQNPNQAKALLRGANNISMGTVAKDMARGWHCVHSSAVAIEPKRSLTEPAIPLPLTAIPIEPATKADSQRLPTIRPEAATPGDVKASAILGQSNTSTSAPKWTIRPINDFDRLSFILNVSENPKEAAKPALAKPSSASTDGRDVPSIAEGSTMPPEFPHSIPESTRKTAQSNKAFVKALRKAFTRIGLTHAIDDNGRLILNKASGIRFPSGEGNLSRSSLPRAKVMLKIYTEVLLSELPESAATARLAVIGYSTPSLRMNPASTQQANRKISRIRAELIRELITQFNIWPPDQITIDGLGNINPIERKDRTEGECGIYDCELSRRVEVSPIFKEKAVAN